MSARKRREPRTLANHDADRVADRNVLDLADELARTSHAVVNARVAGPAECEQRHSIALGVGLEELRDAAPAAVARVEARRKRREHEQPPALAHPPTTAARIERNGRGAPGSARAASLRA